MNDNPFENFVIENIDSKKKVPLIEKAYLLKGSNNTIIALSFVRFKWVDTNFIHNVVASVVYDGVYDSLFTGQTSTYMNFLGHHIKLGGACHWMGTDNMQCSHYGQISWSVYQTLADAEEYKQIQIDVTKAKRINKVLSEGKVPVIFEGKETIADRIVYKVKLPKMLLNRSNILIAYYVAAEVRGKYANCTMSFFDDEAPKGKLAPLINEVMQLK